MFEITTQNFNPDFDGAGDTRSTFYTNNLCIAHGMLSLLTSISKCAFPHLEVSKVRNRYQKIVIIVRVAYGPSEQRSNKVVHRAHQMSAVSAGGEGFEVWRAMAWNKW
jgi:hypothetical protein